MGATIGAARIELTVNSAKFEAQMKRAEAAVGKFKSSLNYMQRRFKSTGRKMERFGNALSRNVAIPIAAIGGASLKAAIDFESAFAGVRKTVTATESQFGALRKEIIDMSKELPASASEISGIAEAAGQLGIKSENILTFTRTMADLGVATNLTSERAATALARLANITQMSQTDFDRLGSVVVDLGNNLATTEAEIIEMAQRLAGSAKQAGLAESEILSMAGALSSVGIAADAGGTAFSKVFDEINLAVQTGSKKLADFARVSGMGLTQFTEMFKKDAARAVVTFIEGLGKMESQGSSAIATLEEMGIRERRLRDALLRASGAGDLFRRAIELGNKAWEKNIALTKEAAERYKTDASLIEITKNKFNALAITIGDILRPTFRKALELLGKVTEAFDNLSSEAKTKILAVAGLLGASGPILVAIGTLTAALGAISWPVTLGVAGFVAASGVIMKHWNSITEYFTSGDGAKIWLELKDLAAGTMESLKGLFRSFTSAAGNIWSTYGDNTLNSLRESFGVIKTVIQTALDVIGFALDVFTARWYSDWDGFLSDNERRAKTFSQNIRKYFDFSDLQVFKAIEFLIPGGAGGDMLGASLKPLQDAADKANKSLSMTSTLLQRAGHLIPQLDFSGPVKGAKMLETETQRIAGQIQWLMDFIKKDWTFGISYPENTLKNGKGGEEKEEGITNKFFGASNPIDRVITSAIRLREEVMDTSAVYTSKLADMKAATTGFTNIANVALISFMDKMKARGQEFLGKVIPVIESGIKSMASSFIEGVGQMAAGTQNLKGVFGNVMITLADLAIRVGKIAVGIAIAIEGIKQALRSLNPAVALAAGVALLAIGAAAKSALFKAANVNTDRDNGSRKVPALAAGGILTGPSLIVAGDNPNAKVDPEVVSPLSKLKGMMGGEKISEASMERAMRRALADVRWKQKGSDLVAVIETTKSRTLR